MIADQTIVAIATPPGLGGVAIVRLSGPQSEVILNQIYCPRRSHWQSHKLYYGKILDGETIVDQVLAVVMRAPHSYTCEDVVELHCHGGSMVAEKLVEVCVALGARLARPGEFTLRAFLNGRLDLAQAESVLEVIHSRSQAALRLAASNLEGRLSAVVGEVREDLLVWLSLLEAEIDFGDEVEGLSLDQSRQRLRQAQLKIEELLAGGQQGKLVSAGVRVALVGPPNAGKSTLLNALLGEERALVTDIAGTTRDTLEESCLVHGVAMRLVDTAGLRQDTLDPVERLGMERSRKAIEYADLVVVVLDGSRGWPADFQVELKPDSGQAAVVLLNKRDLGTCIEAGEARERLPVGEVFCGSLLDPEAAVEWLAGCARSLTTSSLECFSVNQRHFEALVRARECLGRVDESLTAEMSAEFLCLDLRAAAEALGEILGIDVSEEILDRIFSTFCLGK